MARITENPKFIGLGILLALGVGVYLYLPDFWKQITAPPKKPKMPSVAAKLSEEQIRFYRMIPDRLPDKVGELLAPVEPLRTVFDEVPRRQKTAEEKGEPPLIPESWRLTSVFISPEQRAAVISGQAVMEGEVIGSFTVAKIEPERVVLRHPFGERIMGFPPRSAEVIPPPPPGVCGQERGAGSPAGPSPAGQGGGQGLATQPGSARSGCPIGKALVFTAIPKLSWQGSETGRSRQGG